MSHVNANGLNRPQRFFRMTSCAADDVILYFYARLQQIARLRSIKKLLTYLLTCPLQYVRLLSITLWLPRLRNDLYCVEWDVKPHTIPYHTLATLTNMATYRKRYKTDP